MLDATPAFAGFGDLCDDVAGAVRDEAFKVEQRGSLGGNGDSGSAEFPRELVAGCQRERIAHFFRDGCLTVSVYRAKWTVGVGSRSI